VVRAALGISRRCDDSDTSHSGETHDTVVAYSMKRTYLWRSPINDRHSLSARQASVFAGNLLGPQNFSRPGGRIQACSVFKWFLRVRRGKRRWGSVGSGGDHGFGGEVWAGLGTVAGRFASDFWLFRASGTLVLVQRATACVRFHASTPRRSSAA
jgi:hypothetical protein